MGIKMADRKWCKLCNKTLNNAVALALDDYKLYKKENEKKRHDITFRAQAVCMCGIIHVAWWPPETYYRKEQNRRLALMQYVYSIATKKEKKKIIEAWAKGTFG